MKEIIGLSVGEVVLPVLVGLAINETKPYMFMLLLFVMAVMVIGLYFIVELLIRTKPSVEYEQRRDTISSMDESRNPLMGKGQREEEEEEER